MEDTANILKKEEIILNISSTYKLEKLAKDKLHRKDHVETIRTRMKIRETIIRHDPRFSDKIQ